MIVILTGATSFLGRAVRSELEKRGHKVFAFRHSFEENGSNGVLLPETADTWIHFAWAGVGSKGRSDPSIQAYNVNMSLSALKKACELGCKSFIFAGSQAEYGNLMKKSAILKTDSSGRKDEADGVGFKEGSLQTEDMLCDPVSEYGKAKLKFLREAQSFIRESSSDIAYIHMRIFSVYGPGDHESSLISSSVKSFLANKAMEFGPCTQDWNYLYIDDAAKAVASLMETEGAQGIYNVAGRDTRPLRDYIEELFKLCAETAGMPLSRETAGNMLKFGMRGDNAEGAVSLRPDIRRITAETGWEPETDFRTGIKKTLEFYKSR